MRSLILSAFILLGGLAEVAAMSMPGSVPTTYPEPGTFCGFMTLCPDVEVTKGQG
ncbi:MAG: hypothetical protein AAFQ64_12210 [Pseudomonadota bacterium]